MLEYLLPIFHADEKPLKIQHRVIIGGVSMKEELRELTANKYHVITGTPGVQKKRWTRKRFLLFSC